MSKFNYIFIIFFYFFCTGSLSANADIYLATGVLTAEPKTDKLRLDFEADLRSSNPEVYESQDFKSAYNTSSGFWDFIEGAAQLLGQNGWSIYWDSFITLTNNRLTQHYIDYFSQVSQNHDADLSEQISNYKASINSGNQVIVIAHSQGNYFTNEAYDALNECQKKSFYMLGTANPADHVSGMDEGRGALATLNNDPITFVPSSMSPNIINDDTFIIEGYSFKLPKYHYFDYYRNNNIVTQSKIDTFPEYAMHHYNENKTPASIPQSGMIDIKLSWGNPSLHMNLGSEIGIKDISYTGCSSVEHYYVASEENVSPGWYGVYVSSSGGVDNSYFPQSVDLTIHVPGAVTVFDFNITAADMLNLGHVADIIITEDKKSEVVQVAGSSNTGNTYTTVRCYGDCQNENASGTYIDYLYGIQSKLKQALLGPLSNAGITLTKAEKFINNTPFYESSTSGGSSILGSGVFYFPDTVTSAIKDDELYIMSVTGGRDIDANDDGVLDSNVTINNGTVRAIVSGAQLKNDDFKVNILTEITFQDTKLMLNDELNVTAVDNHMDSIAKKLLFRDVQGDKLSDYNTVVHWLPMVNKDKLQFDYDEKIEPIVQKIYNNEDIYLDVYKLLYAGKVDSLNATGNSIRVDLNSYADLSQLQKEDFVLSDSSGNSVDFTFAIVDGKVDIDPLNDLVEGQSYTLSFDLKIYDSQNNVYVDTQLYTFTIPDITPPVIPESTIHINENYEGDLPFNASDPSTPLTYSIAGGTDSALFEIKNIFIGYGIYADKIYFKEMLNFERPADQNGDNIYELDISVADSFENITTQRIRIIVDNVAEGPELADTNLTVNENALVGTYVGSMTVLNEGDGNITEFFINGYDALFSINSSGEIYTKATFDFEKIETYLFEVGAKNSADGYSNRVALQVKINDIDESLPTVHHFTGSMDDHAPAGKVVGQLYVDPGLDSNISMRLIGDGTDDFDVNASGHITVSATADLNHATQKQYDLKAIATNSYGDSNEANVTIYISSWTKQFGTSLNDLGSAVATDSENNVFVSGTTSSLFLYKYNSEGEELWKKEYPEIARAGVAAIALDDNGAIYLAGKQGTDAYLDGGKTYYRNAAWLAAFSPNGVLLWSTTFDSGIESWDAFKKIVVNTDGDLIVAGETSGAFGGNINSGWNDVFVVRLSNMQEVRWIKQFGSSRYDVAKDIALNANGELYLLVDFFNNTLMKLEKSSGNILWKREFTSPTDGPWIYYRKMSFDSENNIYLLAEQEEYWDLEDGSSHYDWNIELTKLSLDGEILWSNTLGTDQYELPMDIAINAYNEIYVAGSTEGNMYNNYSKTPYSSEYEKSDFFLMQIDTDGNMLKTKQYGSIYYDELYRMCINTDNDIIMTGYVSESLDGNHYFGGRDAFLMKVPY